LDGRAGILPEPTLELYVSPAPLTSLFPKVFSLVRTGGLPFFVLSGLSAIGPFQSSPHQSYAQGTGTCPDSKRRLWLHNPLLFFPWFESQNLPTDTASVCNTYLLRRLIPSRQGKSLERRASGVGLSSFFPYSPIVMGSQFTMGVEFFKGSLFRLRP